MPARARGLGEHFRESLWDNLRGLAFAMGIPFGEHRMSVPFVREIVVRPCFVAIRGCWCPFRGQNVVN